MRRVILPILALAAAGTICVAEITKLPLADQKALQRPARFTNIATTSELPQSVRALCADGFGAIAQPGEPWQVTDVVVDKELPARRMIWAVTDGEYFVVHYERGGIAHSYHVLVAKLKTRGGKPDFVWQAIGGPLKNYDALIEALTKNKLDDRLDFGR